MSLIFLKPKSSFWPVFLCACYFNVSPFWPQIILCQTHFLGSCCILVTSLKYSVFSFLFFFRENLVHGPYSWLYIQGSILIRPRGSCVSTWDQTQANHVQGKEEPHLLFSLASVLNFLGFCLFVLFWLKFTHGGAQNLFLVLYSGVTLGFLPRD